MIIVLGMAGSGKTTLCKALNDTGSFRWVSTSGLLLAHTTPEIEAYRSAGKMVPEHIVVPLIVKDLEMRGDTPEVLLDGFPRTEDQALGLSAMPSLKPRLVLHLVVNEHNALERLQLRKRDDDTEEAIRQRFSDYNESIEHILTVFRNMNVDVVDVDANPPVEEVRASAKRALGVA